MLHPPGQKVYQRGAHTIWEVDGAVQKVLFLLCCSDHVNPMAFLIPAVLSKSLPFRQVLYRCQDPIL